MYSSATPLTPSCKMAQQGRAPSERCEVMVERFAALRMIQQPAGGWVRMLVDSQLIVHQPLKEQEEWSFSAADRSACWSGLKLMSAATTQEAGGEVDWGPFQRGCPDSRGHQARENCPAVGLSSWVLQSTCCQWVSVRQQSKS
jgi:hypothetical protein